MSKNVPSLVTGHMTCLPGSVFELLWAELVDDRDIACYIDNHSVKDVTKSDSV